MQDRIICLVGASGSGKTTIAKELEKMGYNIIMSYTTREPREENEWGHKFIPNLQDRNINYIKNTKYYGAIIIQGKREVQNFLEEELAPYAYYHSEVIAHREIYGEHYWATRDQYKGKGTSIYVVCPDGSEQVRKNVKDAEVTTIFLMADEDIRALRIAQRSYKDLAIYRTSYIKTVPHIKERLEKDKEIFKTCECNYFVDANREVKEVLEDVVSIIEGVK